MKVKNFILLLAIFFTKTYINAQNIISNGSFEVLESTTCVTPPDGFNQVTQWYNIEGTPDLFIANCPVSSTGEIFWSSNSAAFEGQNFIGFKCRVNSNQSYLSEGIATQLTQTLEADQSYFITFKIRNKGIYQGFPASVISCPLKPEKKIEIYTHSDTIRVVNDFSNGSASSNGKLTATVKSSTMQSDNLVDEWFSVGTCFIAGENVSHLSMIMPLGNFGTFPACSANDTRGTFFSYYFEMDDVVLDRLPEDTLITRYIAKGDQFEIYIPEVLNLSFISDAIIIWSDGFDGSRRTLNEAGTYEMDVMLDCGVISVTLEVLLREEEFPFFIPNVFSPNDDGINDMMEVFIPDDKNTNSYLLQVFDRWGNKVFETKDINESWDGTLNGAISDGQFIYHLTCTITDETGIQDFTKTDIITIIK